MESVGFLGVPMGEGGGVHCDVEPKGDVLEYGLEYHNPTALGGCFNRMRMREDPS
jgi:hypothetical protein